VIILDTHILLWLNLEQRNKIPAKMMYKIESSGTQGGISAISLWETSMLYQKKRIKLPYEPLEWFRVVFSNPNNILLPITPEIAAISGTLQMHGDPADRIIAATSLFHKSKLATLDEKLCELEFLDII